MEDIAKNLNEEVTTNEDDNTSGFDSNAFKKVVEDELSKIQTQNLLLGAQTACTVILEKITTAMSQPGKRSMNDYKRLIKDLENFCRTGLSRKVNPDGTTDPVKKEDNTSETVQN